MQYVHITHLLLCSCVFHKSQIALKVQRESCVGGLVSFAEVGQASKYVHGAKAAGQVLTEIFLTSGCLGQGIKYIQSNHPIKKKRPCLPGSNLQGTRKKAPSLVHVLILALRKQGLVDLRDEPGLQKNIPGQHSEVLSHTRTLGKKRKTKVQVAGEIVQWISCLLCKLKGQSLISSESI